MAARLRGLAGVGLFLAGGLVGGLVTSTWPTRPAVAEVGGHWEAVVYLPLVDNQDRPIPEADWNDALALLVAEGGGATLGDRQEGLWLDAQNRLRRELVRPVVVSFPRDRLDAFRRAVREAGRRLGQEAMYVRLEEPHVEVLPVAAENSPKDH